MKLLRVWDDALMPPRPPPDCPLPASCSSSFSVPLAPSYPLSPPLCLVLTLPHLLFTPPLLFSLSLLLFAPHLSTLSPFLPTVFLSVSHHPLFTPPFPPLLSSSSLLSFPPLSSSLLHRLRTDYRDAREAGESKPRVLTHSIVGPSRPPVNRFL